MFGVNKMKMVNIDTLSDNMMEKMMIIWCKRWWRIEIVFKNEDVGDDLEDGERERERERKERRESESPPNMGE